jgi:hypothetical protein
MHINAACDGGQAGEERRGAGDGCASDFQARRRARAVIASEAIQGIVERPMVPWIATPLRGSR